jgi:hypothetical protein
MAMASLQSKASHCEAFVLPNTEVRNDVLMQTENQQVFAPSVVKTGEKRPVEKLRHEFQSSNVDCHGRIQTSLAELDVRFDVLATHDSPGDHVSEGRLRRK